MSRPRVTRSPAGSFALAVALAAPSGCDPVPQAAPPLSPPASLAPAPAAAVAPTDAAGAPTAATTRPGEAPTALTTPPRTALLSVLFRADGTLAIDHVSPRPFAFRGLPPTADPPRLAPLPPFQPPAAGALARDPAPATTPRTAPALPPHAPPAGDAIVVEHPHLARPLVVPIDLGAPGEGGGDVADRWAGGATILRAPWFGPRTTYAIVRAGAVLARTEPSP